MYIQKMFAVVMVTCFLDDRCCQIWDLESGKLASRLQLKHPCMRVTWHADDPMKVNVI